MQRAVAALTPAVAAHLNENDRILVVCGSGNNGGDGLGLAAELHRLTYQVTVVCLALGEPSPDNRAMRERAQLLGLPLHDLAPGQPLPDLPAGRGGRVIIDAIFGTGLSRPISNELAQTVAQINDHPARRLAIDLPSGLPADGPAAGAVVRAHRTFSLGYPKYCLFSPAAADYLGEWQLAPFRLSDHYPTTLDGDRLLTTDELRKILRGRGSNDHKGTFGHALLVAGSYGRMGAALLSARGILRAGAGLLSVHVPRAGVLVLQTGLPEAMCRVDGHEYHLSDLGQFEPAAYDAVAAGPGLGQDPLTARALGQLLDAYRRPLVLDADALNLIAARGWLRRIPPGSILTPHPKEFARLFGDAPDDFARWELQRRVARKHGLVLLLKTGYTSVATPGGKLYFNPTGNPGMATAGSGDTLTGIITGLLAQGYTPTDAARLGVYLHGLAGDLAAARLGQEPLLAGDLTDYLGAAYARLRTG